MNSLGLIYHELSLLDVGLEVEVPTANDVYTAVRQHIKPRFSNWKLKANNVNGEGTRSFNLRVSRFKHDWLGFILLDHKAPAEYYPTETEMAELKINRDTDIASVAEWREIIAKEIAEGKIYLLVGMAARIPQKQSRFAMLSGGLPPEVWPCKFELFEFVVTNAPICQFIRHRAHVLV